MKRSLTAAAALLLALLFSGCALLNELLDGALRDRDEGGGNNVKFSEIVYRRPDLETLSADFETLISALEKEELSVRKAVSRLEKVYGAYNDFYTMDNVAELRYYHDVTDSFYADECDWFLENEPTVDQLFEELCYASANCSIAEELDERFWGGWVIDAYGEPEGGGEPEPGTDDSGREEGTARDPEYLAMDQDENAILAEYRRIMADPTVSWRGEEYSYWSLEQDDSLSPEDWDEVRGLYYDKYAPILGELYLRLVAVRQEQAAYFGYDGYEAFAYDWLYERDYGPAETAALLEQIRRELAPLYGELSLNERWDALRYTELNEEENLEALRTASEQLGGQILLAFREMERCELCDIEISEKKGDLSYQCFLYSYDEPFIFVKTEGWSDDILSFGHEFGHFVDAWYNHNGTASHDLAEVFSQGMEYMLLDAVPEDYREELTEYKLLDTVDTFAQQGSFAEFEHEVYARPASEWTPEALEALSLRLAKEYGYFREGEEDYYAKSWIDINHFFDNPFYVVGYCVSNDAAFQIYELECAETGAGLSVWNKMLPRQNDGFLDTVVGQGGLKDPFGDGRMKEIADLMREKLR